MAGCRHDRRLLRSKHGSAGHHSGVEFIQCTVAAGPDQNISAGGIVFDQEERRGHAIDSIISGGCILSGGVVRNSVLGRAVRVHSGAVVVEDSVILTTAISGGMPWCAEPSLIRTSRCRKGAPSVSIRRRTGTSTTCLNGIVVVEGVRSSVEVTVFNLGSAVERRKKRSAESPAS